LFIAVSMIVLVLEEARHINEQVQKQVQAVKSEKEALQLRILSAEEKYQSLFDQTRSRDDLQKAYDELRQTQQSVVQQERLRALGQMASGIAHDVNNALSPVLAFADMVLRKETELSDASRKNLEHIKTAAEDIAHIVERMSEFHRRREENKRLQLVNVNRLVEQVVALTRPRWQDMAQSQGVLIRVEPVLDEKIPELYANESELRETLTNLILNSVDAMPKGGTVTIGIRGLSANAEFFSRSGPSHLVLEVRDTGQGMDEKTRQRCLEPFFSTKRDRGGTGLGLAMVYGMMERHEGTIEVESELGKGTTVRLIFPLRQAPSITGDTVLTPRAPQQPLRVLCIDDEPLLRELLKEVLEFEKHQVVTADGGQTGLEAFQAAQDRGEPFDIVVTDLGMPHIDGRAVAQAIKTNSSATPVIMLTGWGTMLNERGDLPTNVDAILSKPPRPSELHDTLLQVFSKRRKIAA
jgi:signal transduction histidine kinase/ActR/RegA family two-component response regulator